MDDAHIRRSAEQMWKLHGEGAAMQCAQEAEKMRVRNDSQGHAVWTRIMEMVRGLERQAPRDGGAPN